MKIIILALALVCVSLCQEGTMFEIIETLIQLGNGARLTNLNKLMSLDYSQLDCTTNLLQLKHELKMWGELYDDEKVIHHEIKMLSTAHKILVENRLNRHRNSSINIHIHKDTLQRAKRVLAALKQNTHKKQHTIYQQWRINEITDLKNSIQLLQNSASNKNTYSKGEDESKQCCDRLEQQINKFLEERKHVAKQCGNTDVMKFNMQVTINIINDAEGRIEIVQKKCKDTDPDIKINRLDQPQQVIVGQNQEQKKEVVVTKQEQVVVSQPQKQEVVVQEQKEQVVVSQSKQSEQVVVKQEEVVTEVVSESRTETTKTVSVPDDDDDEEVVGEAVQTQGVAASGEKGRQ